MPSADPSLIGSCCVHHPIHSVLLHAPPPPIAMPSQQSSQQSYTSMLQNSGPQGYWTALQVLYRRAEGGRAECAQPCSSYFVLLLGADPIRPASATMPAVGTSGAGRPVTVNAAASGPLKSAATSEFAAAQPPPQDRSKEPWPSRMANSRRSRSTSLDE